ncbi:uncharacterized protein KY384_007116 [Bacidia gigantensis]|uniref:uncharacterized protein n=1 Tax=Bacidia gigantensis TaxID=2732470 RepID=UPI001D054C2B|nr:uncharacterized protein KY384_007116 [Bacidia gigantensis]KAG8528199.1 hypothetical protein KY384_007116 [Bacidia gigantensis]
MSSAVPMTEPHDTRDDISNYGSDFSSEEESILHDLLKVDIDNPNKDISLEEEGDRNYEGPRRLKLPRTTGNSQLSSQDAPLKMPSLNELPVDTVDQHNKSASTDVASEESRAVLQNPASIEAPVDPRPEQADLRSPLERFRSKPRKAFSVTDMISPSWCELQYWYVLTKHGRKRRTPAMKQGTAIHKVLEEQVHTTVVVDVRTKEDSWGLRIWNVIQGLRTLRETGMTRELEIWGTVDGLVMNGIIDELSYTCPDRELEHAQESTKSDQTPLDADQATITDFLGPSGTLESNGMDIIKTLQSTAQKRNQRVYVADVKTRGVKTLPKGSTFRPTLLQLMLYHRTLAELATNKVDPIVLFDRYNLNPDTPFTDGFIAQVGSLNDNIHDSSVLPSEASQQESMSSEYVTAASNQSQAKSNSMEYATAASQQTQSSLASTQDSMTQLLGHNSIRELWYLMIREFALTLPHGAKSLGNVLKAEYRDSTSGDIMGAKTFLYDENTIEKYLSSELEWWRGERAAQGVSPSEAFKCGSCEFFDDCSWRKNKIEDAVNKMRDRRRSLI